MSVCFALSCFKAPYVLLGKIPKLLDIYFLLFSNFYLKIDFPQGHIHRLKKNHWIYATNIQFKQILKFPTIVGNLSMTAFYPSDLGLEVLPRRFLPPSIHLQKQKNKQRNSIFHPFQVSRRVCNTYLVNNDTL